MQDIGDLISLRYMDQCGIVYCLSRSVLLADDLYHAGLECFTVDILAWVELLLVKTQ